MHRKAALFAIIVQCFHLIDSSAPQRIRVSQIGPGYARIEWTAPADHDAITGYQVLYTDDYNLPDRKWEKRMIGGQTGMVVVKGLNNRLRYFFKIKAVFDNNMIGQASEVYELAMTGGLNSEMTPKITQVTEGTRRTIAYVYWTKPDYLDGKLLKYELRYGPAHLIQTSKTNITIDKSTYENFEEVNSYMVKVMNLMHNTVYQFVIKVITKDNLNGVNSNVYKFKTNPKPKPINLPEKKPSGTIDRNPTKNLIQFILEIPSIHWIDWFKICVLLSPIWYLIGVKKKMNVSAMWATIAMIPRYYRAKTLLKQANNYYNKRNYYEALKAFESFESLIQCNTNKFDLTNIFLKMAICSESLDDIYKCLHYCNKAISRHSKNIEALLLKGRTLTRLGEFLEAVFIYEDIYLLMPTLEHERLLQDAHDRWQREQHDNNNDHDEEPNEVPTDEYLTYLNVLGLPEGATQKQIRDAYLNQARKFHTDKNVDSTEEEKKSLNEKFIQIRKAYENLTVGT